MYISLKQLGGDRVVVWLQTRLDGQNAFCGLIIVVSDIQCTYFEFFWFLASSESTKMSTPLLEYLKMKRSSRGRPVSSVSAVDEYIISRFSDSRIWSERSVLALGSWVWAAESARCLHLIVPFWYASAHITQVGQAMVCILVRRSRAEIPIIGETKSLIIRSAAEVYQKGTTLFIQVTVMILKPYQVSDLISQNDIRTVITASDWLISYLQ